MAITSETVQIETFEQIEVTDAMKAEPDADTLALCESLGRPSRSTRSGRAGRARAHR